MSKVHIIGGGIAGLSAAVELAPQTELCLYEGAAICGGRARSFDDSRLGCQIDNGNHLFLSANKYLLRYVDLIGSRNRVFSSGKPFFPFFDLKTKKAWKLSLSCGKIPFWLLFPSRRPPKMNLRELRSFLNFLKASPETTVAECLESGGLTDLLLKPLAISALNTSIEEGSAALFANVMRESLFKGGKGCHPLYPLKSLADSFIDPAVAYVKNFRSEIRLNTRIRELIFKDGRVVGLHAGGEVIDVSLGDSVILATPSNITRELLPGIEGPDEYESILNLHFHLPFTPSLTGPLLKSGFLGINNGISEWVFVRNNILSVTVSAANHYANIPKEVLVQKIWQELQTVLAGNIRQDLKGISLPEYRFINEKRATFAATPRQNRKRPGTATPFLNLVLAGDWIATGLPSTLEGSVRSGLAAVGELGFRSAISEGYQPV